jgi:hypothetical protein
MLTTNWKPFLSVFQNCTHTFAPGPCTCSTMSGCLSCSPALNQCYSLTISFGHCVYCHCYSLTRLTESCSRSSMYTSTHHCKLECDCRSIGSISIRNSTLCCDSRLSSRTTPSLSGSGLPSMFEQDLSDSCPFSKPVIRRLDCRLTLHADSSF